MYRSSPFRSTLNTGYITCLGMCKVCTEAVHSVALWTRVTLRWDMCKVCTEAVHSVALWTRVTLRWDMCKVCTEAVHSVALWTRVVKTCQFHGAVNTSSAKTTTEVVYIYHKKKHQKGIFGYPWEGTLAVVLSIYPTRGIPKNMQIPSSRLHPRISAGLGVFFPEGTSRHSGISGKEFASLHRPFWGSFGLQQ